MADASPSTNDMAYVIPASLTNIHYEMDFVELLQKVARTMLDRCVQSEGSTLREINGSMSFTVINFFI